MNQPPIEDIRRQNAFIIVSAVMIVVALLFVILRCVSRFILIRNPGPDDYFIIAAMTLTLGYLVNVILAAQNGIGLPMSTLTLQNMVNFLKIVLAIEVMYYVNVFCIKVSILFTYLRIAVTRTFRNLCIGTIILHVVFVLVCIFVTLAQCQPIHKMWDFTGNVKGTCINTTAFFYFTSSFNIVTDIWILLLPISTLRGIHRPPREKVALFLIFGVGTFATIASIVRLHTIYTYTLATDPFHEGTKVNLWSVIEVTIAISCASVSALKPMFSRRQRRLTLGAIGGRSGGHGYRVYGTGTGTGADNTGTGTGAGSRSTGTWVMAKSKGGGNNGLGTQSSEIGLHDDEEEEIELQRLGSHAETLVDDQSHAETQKEGENEFMPAHSNKEYRRWSQHSSSARSRQQQQQQRQRHSRQQSTSSFISPAPSMNGQNNLPTTTTTPDDSASSPLSPIQRPKPAAVALNNQTRPLSFPPPLSPNQIAVHMGLKYPGYQGPGQQYQGNHTPHGLSSWAEVPLETAASRTVFTSGTQGGARGRERGMSETASTTGTSRQIILGGHMQGQGHDGGGIWAGLSGQSGQVASTGTTSRPGPGDGTGTSGVTRPAGMPRASTFGN